MGNIIQNINKNIKIIEEIESDEDKITSLNCFIKENCEKIIKDDNAFHYLMKKLTSRFNDNVIRSVILNQVLCGVDLTIKMEKYIERGIQSKKDRPPFY